MFFCLFVFLLSEWHMELGQSKNMQQASLKQILQLNEGHMCTNKWLLNGATPICFIQTMWPICRRFLKARTAYVVLSTEALCMVRPDMQSLV